MFALCAIWTDIDWVYLMWQNFGFSSLSTVIIFKFCFQSRFFDQWNDNSPFFLYSINMEQMEENVEYVATPMTLHSHVTTKEVENTPVE